MPYPPSSPCPPSQHMVSLSERLYRLLLLCYPAEFRQAHGREMLQTFRDCHREALQQADRWSVLRLWRLLLSDLATTVFVEHIRAYRALLSRLFHPEKEHTMASMTLHLDVALRTNIGRTRSKNEDNMTSVVPQDPQVMTKKGALFVVADGLGGHEKGEVASEMVISGVNTAYYEDNGDDIATSLLQAVKHANTAICKLVEQEGRVIGSTCIAAVLHGETVYIANVGDSRAYIVRAGQVKQISQDHSWVAEQVRVGALTKEEARTHEQRNVITRCIGTKADVEVDLFTEAVQHGDVLVLCTDGLSSLVSDEELGTIVEQYGPEESVDHLIERANENGGPDNITAVVVRVALG